MTKAFLSVWYNYTKDTQYYKIFYDYFVENFHLWCDLVDTVYIVDNEWYFTEEDKKRLTDIKKEVVFLKSSKPWHKYIDFKEILDQVKEDQILFMDNDCIIYDRKGVQTWFDTIGDHDCVITLSEGHSLREVVFQRFPILKEKNKPGIWLNHFLVTRKFLNSLKIWDFRDFQPFPVGTLIPELSYVTKEGDWGEYCCHLIWQMFESDWVEMPYIQLQGFKHLHWGSFSQTLLTWKENNDPNYWKFLKEQPADRYLFVMALFNAMDTKGKYTKETKEVMFDLLKSDTRTIV